METKFVVNIEDFHAGNSETAAQTLKRLAQYSTCYSVQWLKTTVERDVEYSTGIHLAIESMQELLRMFPESLKFEETDTGFIIRASAQPSPGGEIRGVEHLTRHMPGLFPEGSDKVIQQFYTAALAYRADPPHQWPDLKAKWARSENTSGLPSVFQDSAAEWKRINGGYPSLYCLASFVSDVVEEGNGLAIFKQVYETYRCQTSLCRMYREESAGLLKTAEIEFALYDRIKAGQSFEQISRDYPEGSLKDLPYDSETAQYFERLYPIVKQDEYLSQWIKHSKYCEDFPRDLYGKMGELTEGRYICWGLQNVKIALRNWPLFVTDLLKFRCLGIEMPTASQL